MPPHTHGVPPPFCKNKTPKKKNHELPWCVGRPVKNSDDFLEATWKYTGRETSFLPVWDILAKKNQNKETLEALFFSTFHVFRTFHTTFVHDLTSLIHLTHHRLISGTFSAHYRLLSTRTCHFGSQKATKIEIINFLRLEKSLQFSVMFLRPPSTFPTRIQPGVFLWNVWFHDVCPPKATGWKSLLSTNLMQWKFEMIFSRPEKLSMMR